jgi:hypothetical protein
MKTQNVMVLLASLLSSTTVLADVPASDAANRATFASLHPVGEATIARLEKERRHKFSFDEVRTIVTGTTWQTELSKTEKAHCAAGKPDEKLAHLIQCPDK